VQNAIKLTPKPHLAGKVSLVFRLLANSECLFLHIFRQFFVFCFLFSQNQKINQ
jgi:hypothetical protein